MEVKKIPQFVIAAPTSNSGKTTITLGLLRCLKDRGLNVQPFKVGPDFIDPKFHHLAAGTDGVNLDRYMMGDEKVKESYQSFGYKADVCVTEGVMGLFDGAKRSEGSTAELAMYLGLPVILVVDAKAVAFSVAAMIYGFKNFNPDLNLVGVIFNRVNTESHYRFLKEACEDVGVEALGRLPFLEDCEIPSRHLGLSIDRIQQYEGVVRKVADTLSETVDVDHLLSICNKPIETSTTQNPTLKTKKIAIARDAAFNFIYPQVIQQLEAQGEVTFFSPLTDEQAPDVDLIYLPGGYPECFADQLSTNRSMLQSIRQHSEEGREMIAECGGMMYLGQSFIDKLGVQHSMAGIFDYSTSMENAKLSLGYRTWKYDGKEIKGHEFHYSNILNDESIETLGELINARNQAVKSKVYRQKSTIASYMHFFDFEKTINIKN